MNCSTLERKNDNTPAAGNRPADVVRKYTPAVDVYEKADELTIIADVPGARADGVSIQFERGALKIEAAVAPRCGCGKGKSLLREYGVGHYERTFEINQQIDAEKIAAKLDNGVLTITLPKAEAAKPRKIPVQSA